MAGRMGKRGGASGVVPTTAPAIDLTAARGLTSLSGERVVDVARKTLDASERLIGAWDELEPIVRSLLVKVKAHADSDLDPGEATALLRDIATVASRVGTAATAVMRASEGQVRLAVLIEGPKPQRRSATDMTEKQLVSVMVETLKKVATEQGICPVCTKSGTATVVVSPNGKGTDDAGAPV
jgi:hypothetical protein